MKLKLLIDGKGERYLATESGEILGMFGLEDPEWSEITMKASSTLPVVAKIVIETTKIEYTGLIIDGSVVPSNALPEAPRALPAPRLALPDPEYVEDRLDQLPCRARVPLALAMGVNGSSFWSGAKGPRRRVRSTKNCEQIGPKTP